MTRKPFYKENRKFTESKFTFKLSVGAVLHRPKPCVTAAAACAFCGAVKILSGAATKKRMSFCDRQCRGGWVSQNLDKSNFYGVLARNKQRFALLAQQRMQKNKETQLAKEINRQAELELLKRWKCCVWCDLAFVTKTGSIFCSINCRIKHQYVLKHVQKPVEHTCDYCGKQQLVSMPLKIKRKMCSRRCTRKAHKEIRKYWIRSNGPCEHISLDRLVKRDKGRCRNCQVKVTRYSGKGRVTDASMDHIVPLSKGGWHCWSNVQLLCMTCNTNKSDQIKEGSQLMLSLGSSNPPDGCFLAHDHLAIPRATSVVAQIK